MIHILLVKNTPHVMKRVCVFILDFRIRVSDGLFKAECKTNHTNHRSHPPVILEFSQQRFISDQD